MPKSVVALLVTVLVSGCGSSSTATRTLSPKPPSSVGGGKLIAVNGHVAIHGAGFSAAAPKGWWSARVGNGAEYFLASQRTSLPDTGIPPKGVIALTVVETQISVSAGTPLPTPALQSLVQLASRLASTPPSAANVRALSGVKSLSLADVDAIQYATGYTTDGSENVQEDVVSQNGQYAYLVELDVAPSLRGKGEAALSSFLSTWSWQGQFSV